MVEIITPKIAPTVRPAGQVSLAPARDLKAAGAAMQGVADKFSAYYEEKASEEAELIWTQAQVDWTRDFKERARTAGDGFTGATLKEYDAYVDGVMKTVPLRRVDEMNHAFAKYRINLEAKSLEVEAAARARARAARLAETQRQLHLAVMERTQAGDGYEAVVELSAGRSKAEQTRIMDVYLNTVIATGDEVAVAEALQLVDSQDIFDANLTAPKKLAYLGSLSKRDKTFRDVAEAEKKAEVAEYKAGVEDYVNDLAAGSPGTIDARTKYTPENLSRALPGPENADFVRRALKNIDYAKLSNRVGSMGADEILYWNRKLELEKAKPGDSPLDTRVLDDFVAKVADLGFDKDEITEALDFAAVNGEVPDSLSDAAIHARYPLDVERAEDIIATRDLYVGLNNDVKAIADGNLSTAEKKEILAEYELAVRTGGFTSMDEGALIKIKDALGADIAKAKERLSESLAYVADQGKAHPKGITAAEIKNLTVGNPEAEAALIDMLNDTIELVENIDVIKKGSEEDIAAVFKGVQDAIDAFDDVTGSTVAREAYVAALDARNTAIEKDAAQYVIQNNSDVLEAFRAYETDANVENWAEYSAKLEAHFDRMGVPPAFRRKLSADAAGRLSAAFLAAKPGDLGALASESSDTWGADREAVFNQLLVENDLNYNAYTAASLGSSGKNQTAQELLQKTMKTDEEQTSTALDRRKITDNQVDQAFGEYFEPYKNAWMAGAGAEGFNLIASRAGSSKDMIRYLLSTTSLTPEEAAANVFGMMFPGEVLDTNFAHMIVPSEYNGQPVDRQMVREIASTTIHNFEEFFPDLALKFEGIPELAARGITAAVLESNGVAVATKDGMTIMYRYPDNPEVIVALPKDMRNALTIGWDELATHPIAVKAIEKARIRRETKEVGGYDPVAGLFDVPEYQSDTDPLLLEAIQNRTIRPGQRVRIGGKVMIPIQWND